jgi:hypothetical protein
MTPNDLEILIHFHVSPSKHPRADAPAVKDAIKCLQMMDLIAPLEEQGKYETTGRGKAHMKQLQCLPLPELKWVDKDQKEIKL